MKYFAVKLLSKIIKIFWIFPVNIKKIVFRSSMGEKYNCNPKYITEYFIENCKNEFELIWIFKDTDKYSFLEDKGIKLCRANSLKCIYHLCTAKFIIDNHGFPSYLPIRSSQITINTWHGGGSYKKGKKTKSLQEEKYNKILRDSTKFYISSCERFSRNNLSDIYTSDRNSILPFGTARNDVFFEDFSDIKRKVIEYYSLPKDIGIVLYAPTFRRMGVAMDFSIDVNAVVSACEKKFSKKFIFEYRLHEFVENSDSKLTGGSNILSVNDYEDMQELIASADIIITDYSSLMWDAAIAKKPCFIFANDIDEYKDERDFYTPIEEWPFPLAQTNNELTDNIVSFDEDVYLADINNHLVQMGSYETGQCAKKILEFVRKKEKERK